jgi:ribose 5-phosphate isomerase RpiB
MRVGIASDHGGFTLKEQIADLLRSATHEVVDFGALLPSPGDDYPDSRFCWSRLSRRPRNSTSPNAALIFS